MLANEELEDAKSKFQCAVNSQMDSLSKLKAHREAIANCLENLKQCDDPSEKSRLLQILEDEKKNTRMKGVEIIGYTLPMFLLGKIHSTIF